MKIYSLTLYELASKFLYKTWKLSSVEAFVSRGRGSLGIQKREHFSKSCKDLLKYGCLGLIFKSFLSMC